MNLIDKVESLYEQIHEFIRLGHIKEAGELQKQLHRMVVYEAVSKSAKNAKTSIDMSHTFLLRRCQECGKQKYSYGPRCINCSQRHHIKSLRHRRPQQPRDKTQHRRTLD
jgi:hypothetical protein